MYIWTHTHADRFSYMQAYRFCFGLTAALAAHLLPEDCLTPPSDMEATTDWTESEVRTVGANQG